MELKSKSKMDRIIELANEIKEVEGALDLLRKDLQELIEDNNGGSSVKTSKDRKRWNGWAKRRMAKSMGKYWENLTDAEWDAYYADRDAMPIFHTFETAGKSVMEINAKALRIVRNLATCEVTYRVMLKNTDDTDVCFYDNSNNDSYKYAQTPLGLTFKLADLRSIEVIKHCGKLITRYE